MRMMNLLRRRLLLLLFIFIPVVVVLMPYYSYGASEAFSEGMRFMKTGEFDRAVEMLEKAVREEPQNLRALYQLGIAYYNMGDFEKAQRVWKRAADMLPDNDMMKKTLLDIAARAERHKVEAERKAFLERRIRRHPELLDESFELASLYKKDREFDKAIDLYKKITTLHPDDPRGYKGLAELYYMEGRILWAERYYKRAFKHGSTDSEVKERLDEIGNYLKMLGEKGYEELVKGAHGRISAR